MDQPQDLPCAADDQRVFPHCAALETDHALRVVVSQSTTLPCFVTHWVPDDYYVLAIKTSGCSSLLFRFGWPGPNGSSFQAPCRDQLLRTVELRAIRFVPGRSARQSHRLRAISRSLPADWRRPAGKARARATAPHLHSPSARVSRKSIVNPVAGGTAECTADFIVTSARAPIAPAGCRRKPREHHATVIVIARNSARSKHSSFTSPRSIPGPIRRARRDRTSARDIRQARGVQHRALPSRVEFGSSIARRALPHQSHSTIHATRERPWPAST